MASGKTSKMLDILHKFSNVTKERVLLVNFSGDDRASQDSGISTHMYGDSSYKIPIGKYIDTIRVNALSDIPQEKVDSYNMIGIDEAQFYPDLHKFAMSNITNDLKLYIAGLSFDSDNEVFGEVSKLLHIATTFEKLSAICSKCDPKSMVPAGFTYSSKKKDSVVCIGGLDLYMPLCMMHYYDMNEVND